MVRKQGGVRAGLCAALLGLASVPGWASGFSIFEQGTRAMGMAGAFTAQADDGSALFHNVGGLGFFEEPEFQLGLTYISATEAEFTGTDPYPGPGVFEEQKSLSEFVPHAYWIKPLSDMWKFGVGINSPFGLTTEWDDDYPGRFLTTRASLQTLDITPNIGMRVTENLSAGFGIVARFSEVELDRSQGLIDPFTLRAAEVARVNLQGDLSNALGWQAGLLHKVTEKLTWGFSYRSRIRVHYDGDANFTQVPSGSPLLDDLVAATLPFGSPVSIHAGIDFPDTASLGVAYAVTESILVEVDANLAGWTTFNDVVVEFDREGMDDLVLVQDWEESNNYRVGVRVNRGEKEWRLGYVFDESPIRDENLSPLLPDADRNGVTLGWGQAPGNSGIDLALMYLPFDERTSLDNEVNFTGTYNTTVWLFGVTWNR